tara:strand:- start:34 stop:522 length:489 start_codon:yes stop_codon:yes gene_type:complete
MAKLYMTIGNGDSTWRNIHHKGNTVQLAPLSYPIFINAVCEGQFSYKDYCQNGSYQGCFFVNNPIPNMFSVDFITLVTKINQTIQKRYPSDERNCPTFKGGTYVEIYPQLIKCMDEIIELFKSDTSNSQWYYEESCDINNKLYNADIFIKKWWEKYQKDTFS